MHWLELLAPFKVMIFCELIIMWVDNDRIFKTVEFTFVIRVGLKLKLLKYWIFRCLVTVDSKWDQNDYLMVLVIENQNFTKNFGFGN